MALYIYNYTYVINVIVTNVITYMFTAMPLPYGADNTRTYLVSRCSSFLSTSLFLLPVMHDYNGIIWLSQASQSRRNLV